MLFLASAGFVLYVLFGYPALLGLLARVRPRPVRKEFRPLTVSVLLPVHNGAKYLLRKIESLLALDYRPAEILVLSDGSNDATCEIATQYPEVRLIELPRGGKARALNRGIAEASGEILFFTDVRQPIDPAALRALVACFADPAVGVATGELIIRDGASHEEVNTGLYWKYEKWIRRRLSVVDSVLGATGCIYAMRRELALPIPEDTLNDDMHLPMQAFFRGRRIVMEDNARAYDDPTTLASEFHRKVRTLAGNYQLIGQFPELLGPQNRMWLHYVSYKFARLLLPWALLAMLLSSPPALLVPQILFYALAILDRAIGERSGLKRITAPIRAFVVLMAAALSAVRIFFVPAGRLWKTHA